MADCTLKETIKAAQKDAMRARDKVRLGVIRVIMSELKRIEVDERIELDDARIIATLDKMQKQRRESISQFDAAGRDDLTAVEKNELEVIKTFLPTQLTGTEIEDLIDQAVSATGASSMKDMGAVMAIIRPKAQGRADMADISKRLKTRLN